MNYLTLFVVRTCQKLTVWRIQWLSLRTLGSDRAHTRQRLYSHRPCAHLAATVLTLGTDRAHTGLPGQRLCAHSHTMQRPCSHWAVTGRTLTHYAATVRTLTHHAATVRILGSNCENTEHRPCTAGVTTNTSMAYTSYLQNTECATSIEYFRQNNTHNLNYWDYKCPCDILRK